VTPAGDGAVGVAAGDGHHVAMPDTADVGLPAAIRAGSVGRVVGVERADEADVLRAHVADVVVDDLADPLVRR
jgi:hypothetical protein